MPALCDVLLTRVTTEFPSREPARRVHTAKTKMEGHEAVYTTDEVGIYSAYITFLLSPFLVWEAIHYPTGTGQENSESWHRGDQSMHSVTSVICGF
jgi:hypothetical protein